MSGLRAAPTRAGLKWTVPHGARSNKKIALRLVITEWIRQFHLGNLFAKLEASSRTEMVHLARQKGWIV